MLQSITNDSQWLLEPLPASRVTQRVEVSYVEQMITESPLGCNLQEAPGRGHCLILPAPGCPHCSFPAWAPPSSPHAVPMGSCHLSVSRKAARRCHATPKRSHPLPTPGLGNSPPPEAPCFCSSPHHTLPILLFHSSLGGFIGNTVWPGLPEEGGKGTLMPDNFLLTHTLLYVN